MKTLPGVSSSPAAITPVIVLRVFLGISSIIRSDVFIKIPSDSSEKSLNDYLIKFEKGRNSWKFLWKFDDKPIEEYAK